MTRKRKQETQEQHQEQHEMTDPHDTATGDLLPPAEDPADDSQERAASLYLLEQKAQALEAAAPPDPAELAQAAQAAESAPVGQDPANLSKVVQGAVGVVVKMLSPAFPSLLQIYTPPTIAQLGDAVAPVMVKHGWNLGDLGEKYAEEITLAMVAIPLGMATYQGIQGDIEARKRAAQAQAERNQEQTQGAGNVQQ
jgi:hypothetical protein